MRNRRLAPLSNSKIDVARFAMKKRAVQAWPQETKTQDERVEQAFRPAVKLQKSRLQPLGYSLHLLFNLDGSTAVAEADFFNPLPQAWKACSTLSMRRK